jgi:hypothetical protein
MTRERCLCADPARFELAWKVGRGVVATAARVCERDVRDVPQLSAETYPRAQRSLGKYKLDLKQVACVRLGTPRCAPRSHC